MLRQDRFKDWWANHLAVDHILALAAFAACWIASSASTLETSDRVALLSATATFDGIVLAVSTFAAQMTAQASNPLIIPIRKSFRHLINATWRRTLYSSLMCASGALFAVLLCDTYPHLTDSLAAYFVVLPALRGLRSIDWFVLVNFSEEVAERPKPTLPVIHHSIQDTERLTTSRR